METNSPRFEIEQSIMDGKIETAFSQLKEYIHDNEDHASFLNLWGRHSSLEKDFGLGIINYDTFDRHRNQIRASFVTLLPKILNGRSLQRKKVTFLMRLGLAQMENHEYEAAIGYFDHVITLFPNHITAYMERGVAQMSLARFSSALIDFSKVIELEPAHPFALSNRGAVFVRLGEKEKACADWKKVKELDFAISDRAFEQICR